MAARRSTPPKVLELDDPRAIRAIAHAARQRLIEEIFNGEALTATQAAKLVGLTPSATSYHLRALEKWGIVVRDEASADGRERPWRAAAESLRIGREAMGIEGITGESYVSGFAEGFQRSARAWLNADPRARGGQLIRGRLWITDEENKRLAAEIDALIDKYGDGRDARRHPEGATARDVFWAKIPRVREGADDAEG